MKPLSQIGLCHRPQNSRNRHQRQHQPHSSWSPKMSYPHLVCPEDLLTAVSQGRRPPFLVLGSSCVSSGNKAGKFWKVLDVGNPSPGWCWVFCTSQWQHCEPAPRKGKPASPSVRDTDHRSSRTWHKVRQSFQEQKIWCLQSGTGYT